MIVKIIQIGNSKILTLPKDIRITSDEYDVKNVDDTIVFTPIKKHRNVFSTTSWKNYDYQKDIKNDPTLRDVKPMGRELR